MINQDRSIIGFAIDGRHFKAVALNYNDYTPVEWEKIIDFINKEVQKEGLSLVGSEDELFIYERRRKIPSVLQKFYLFTGRPLEDTERFSCLYFDGDWQQLWLVPEFWVKQEFDAKEEVLVLCSCM